MVDDDAAKTRASLLLRLRQSPDDPSAWGEFVARYGPTILAWGHRWGLQEADAQDVTQAVLVRLAVKLRGFVYDPSRSFRAWLKTLTRHAWSDLVHDQRRSLAGAADDRAREALRSIEARDDLEQRLEASFDLELLELAASRVRRRVEARTWDAFQLTAVEGQSGAEVARRLGMPIASVFKAKSNVQKLMRAEVNLLENVEA